jgi:hypothetical protein
MVASLGGPALLLYYADINDSILLITVLYWHDWPEDLTASSKLIGATPSSIVFVLHFVSNRNDVSALSLVVIVVPSHMNVQHDPIKREVSFSKREEHLRSLLALRQTHQSPPA